jgi:phosphoribosylamine--glycine ligase
VIVCGTEAEALEALERIMVHKEFGEAGKKVVIEEFLVGEEASFMVMTDGETVLPLPTSQDHKAAFDGDRGPNTGGMGAYSPAPVIGEALHERILQKIMVPVVRGMAAEGRPYKGVLYAGLMIDGDSVKVLEFNARFGDPEAQPMLMRIKNDLVPLLEAVIDGRLREHRIDLDPRSAVCVVMASGGYPGGYEKGVPITGLEGAAESSEVMVFHAGTSARNGKTVTAGGRVLGVTALGATVMEAIGRAYGAVSKISFKGAHFRKDIGMKAVKRDSAEAAVGIVMGSDSDLGVMKEAADILKKFGVPYEMTIASAHRSPERALRFASGARERGMKVIIAGAGHAAHLAGVLAAHTSLPVIGVPIDSSCLQGLDALLSTVQMPPGVPVATVSIGKSGARNAGILAVQILGVSDAEIAEKLDAFKKEMAEQVEEKAKKLAEA